MKNAPPIPTAIIPSVQRAVFSASQVGKQFRKLIADGATLKIAGTAKHHPERLNKKNLRPRHRIDLFQTRFYLTDVHQIPELRFFVAYIAQQDSRSNWTIYPRILYKDLSLIWRSASHFTRSPDGIWIGKGDVLDIEHQGEELVVSNESTTDIPHEMQSAVDQLIAISDRPAHDEATLDLVLRRGSTNRIEPYQDFIRPRRQAASNPRNLVNRGRSIAKFTRANDPTSLKIVKGFEPDFQGGVLESSDSQSKLYGGKLRRFRILSTNQKVQYYFFAGKRHVWLAPPQTLTTELSSYGLRTVEPIADDDLFIPGYEYHHYEETANGTELYSQIPSGFAGDTCKLDDAKADASPWLDQIPLIQQFRRQILANK